MSMRSFGLPILAAMFVILGDTSAVRCERRPLPPDVQAQVNRAVDRGIVYLFATQPLWGTWTADSKNHPVGYAALPGLTLLACGESRDHVVIRRAASFVRDNCAKLSATYDLSLALLFLDRLGDPADENLIQTLALRLIAGQSFSGGWSYRCPVLSPGQHQQLLAALRSSARTVSSLPVFAQSLPVFYPGCHLLLGDPPGKAHEVRGTTDNSNTQFATLALWAAQRHTLPLERTMALITYRFHTSQNQDGSWGYHYVYGGGEPERPAMTCAGLLGLAIGYGLAADQEARDNPAFLRARAQVAVVVAFHPPLSFLFLALQRAEKEAVRDRANKRIHDVKIPNGFLALNKHLGEPVGRTEDIPQANLYFLWSVERVAVLYDLATIGPKDWYRWGAEMLVANQKPDGNWDNGGYPSANPVIDTCLALLFLKRTNLVADLTTKLPFDPNALTTSISKMGATPPDPAASPVDLGKQEVRMVARAAPVKSPEWEVNPAVPSGRHDALSPPKPELVVPPEETETAGREGWLWLFVVVALVLFIASGILLASYSLARRQKDPPRWKRYANRRFRKPRRSATPSKH